MHGRRGAGSAPPRKPASQRSRSSSAVRGRISSGAPTSAHAATPGRVESSCDSLVATKRVGAARNQASTPCSLAPVAEAADTALGGAARPERPPVTDAVAEDREVVPQRRDEPAVPPARAVAGEPGLEHDDVDARARATSAATPSRARGTRRRRRPRPRSCRPRAARRARSARPPRATSRSAYAVCRAPASSFSRRRHPAPPSRPGERGDRLSCMRAVAVAQLVEPRVVVPVVAGSSPVRHPFSRLPSR